MRYNLVFNERKNSTGINIRCTDNQVYKSKKFFSNIPPHQDCCIEKLIDDKENIKYINGRTTKCRCRYGVKINNELKRAKAVIDKKNAEISEDRQGYGIEKRKRQRREELMKDPKSFYNYTMYEACEDVMEKKRDSNKKNFNRFNESISKRWNKWKKIKLKEIYTQEFQDKWVIQGRKWVLNGQKGFKFMEGSSYERYTRNMKTIGYHYIKFYPEKTKGITVPLTTSKELHHELRKIKHKDNINIRPMMDWELEMLEENIIQVRKDGKNNHDKVMTNKATLNHKNPAYNECCRAFLYACSCGLRYEDIINLKWHNIIYDKVQAKKIKNYDHTLEVKPSKTKNTTGIKVKLNFNNNQSRFLGNKRNMNDLVFPHLQNFNNGDMRRKWYNDLGKNKFKDEKYFKFHSARDTLVYNLYNKGCSDMVVAKALGDTVQTIQKHYASMCQEIVSNSTVDLDVTI